jgi:lipoprotein-anchoring transpeptidase ErfK/SrfK
MDEEARMNDQKDRLSRRLLLAGALGTAGGAVIGGSAQAAPAGVTEELQADYNGLESVVWPPDLGQTNRQVYFKQSGHTLRGTFLDYWRANGGQAVLGLPISEPFALNGYYTQAFERVALQYRPEYQFVDAPVLHAAPIGQALARANGDLTTSSGQRRLGGGDPRSAVWTPLDPNGTSLANALERGALYFEQTGHTLSGDFLDWYNGNDGRWYLGQPISQTFMRNGQQWQYFEGGALRLTANGVNRAPLTRLAMTRMGIDMSPVEKNGLQEYRESLFVIDPNPNPIGPEDALGRKWIEINLSQQRLWAYQGNTPVMTTLISSGLTPNDTSEGVFYVRIKFRSQTMRGFTSNTGEVVGFGEADDENRPDGSDHYEVEDVPHVMYFTQLAEALHGAYWHNNFGNTMSHGCVNLPLDHARWMYGWAPLGTMVWSHC